MVGLAKDVPFLNLLCISNNFAIELTLSYTPKVSISDLVKRVKGRSARLLLDEFAELKQRYCDQHLWGIGYGAWSSGNITDEMIQEYLEHHREGSNSDQNFILE